MRICFSNALILSVAGVALGSSSLAVGEKLPTATTPAGKKLISLIGRPKQALDSALASSGVKMNNFGNPVSPFGIGEPVIKDGKMVDDNYFDDTWFGYSSDSEDTLDGPSVGTWFAGDHWRTMTIKGACDTLGLKSSEWTSQGWKAFNGQKKPNGYHIFVNKINPHFQIRLGTSGTHNVWLLRVK